MTEPWDDEENTSPEERLRRSILFSRVKVEEEMQQSWTCPDKNSCPNIAHNFQAIRAILTVNAEILDRCMGSMVKTFETEDGKVMAWFCRKGFECVEALGEEMGRYNRCSVSFTATPVISEESFMVTSLCSCPSHLALFKLEYLPCEIEEAKFIDYGALLERSLLLNEKVLETFLVELKKHLEAVQVKLGRIDAWLMEVIPVMEFLETLFDISIPRKPEKKQSSSGSKKQKYKRRNLNLKTLEVNNIQGEFTLKFPVAEEVGRQSLVKFMDFAYTIDV